MGKHLISETAQRSLCYFHHYPVICPGKKGSHPINHAYLANGCCQRAEIRMLRADHGQNVIIYQSLHEQGAPYIGKHAHKNARQHKDQMKSVICKNIFHQSGKEFSGILNLRFRAPRPPSSRPFGLRPGILPVFLVFNHFCSCHYLSPPC